MTLKRPAFWIFTLLAVWAAALLVGTYVAYRAGREDGVSLAIRTHWGAVLSEDTVHASQLVRALKMLRAGDCLEATPALESALDQCIFEMAANRVMAPELVEERRLIEIWAPIKSYRRAHPSDQVANEFVTAFWSVVPDEEDR